MSVRFRSLSMFDSSVSAVVQQRCQKYSTRRGVPMKREPNARRRSRRQIGWISARNSCGSYSRSASWMIDDVAGRRGEPGPQRRALAHVLRLKQHLAPRCCAGAAGPLSCADSQRSRPCSRSSVSSSRLPSVELSSTNTSSLSRSTAAMRDDDLAQRRAARCRRDDEREFHGATPRNARGPAGQTTRPEDVARDDDALDLAVPS